MSKLKILLSLVLLIAIGCHASKPKMEFKDLDVAVLPIIVNNGGEQLSDRFVNSLYLSFLIAKLEIQKDIKVNLILQEPMLLDGIMDFECPFYFPDIDFESAYKYNIIVFVNVPNQCSNLLGCAPIGGIKDVSGVTTALINIEDLEQDTAITIIHEFGHIFGAEHSEDFTVMTSTKAYTFFMNYSKKSMEQIYKVISTLYPKDK